MNKQEFQQLQETFSDIEKLEALEAQVKRNKTISFVATSVPEKVIDFLRPDASNIPQFHPNVWGFSPTISKVIYSALIRYKDETKAYLESLAIGPKQPEKPEETEGEEYADPQL